MNKLKIKRLLLKMNIQLVKAPHKGLDICQDIIRFLPEIDIKVIFDVGANVGQSASEYAFWFPNASIYCFEPSKENFSKLRRNIASHNRTVAFQLALGSVSGTGIMETNNNIGVMSRLTPLKEDPPVSDEDNELTKITTINELCKEQKIDRINYLKIDTEGHDLEVITGADELLNEKRIDIIEVEAGMNPMNDWHVSYQSIQEKLASYGYYPFGFYEQVHEWPTGKRILRRANVAFIPLN